MRGSGYTLAQFLNRYTRYDGNTASYFPNSKAPRCGDYRTVIVDGCSMLTEEQLAALIDSLTNVEQLVLVGDPHQLPPIGAGRPFVDIVNELVPPDIEALFPRCAPGYADLTIQRRQQGETGEDVLLASHFSGRPLDPGADVVWDLLGPSEGTRLRLVQWDHPQELYQKIIEELVRMLKLAGPDDEVGFEMSLGGSSFKDLDRAFFSNRYGDNPGAASKVGAWQMPSPVRSGLEGVDALNRAIQARFRRRWQNFAAVGRMESQDPQALRSSLDPLRRQGHQHRQSGAARRVARGGGRGVHRKWRPGNRRRPIQGTEIKAPRTALQARSRVCRATWAQVRILEGRIRRRGCESLGTRVLPDSPQDPGQ